jgi:CRISPR/Cas system-associated endonuclease Cas3-HD
MDFLKKLFGGGGGGAASSAGDGGLYFYVRPHTCKEVLRIRIDRGNDLSATDDDSGYYCRKLARSSDYHCNREIEMELWFNASKQLQRHEVMGGLMVTEADYQAWLGSQGAEA